VIIPTFEALGIYKVEDWHGRTENGIDIYFSYQDPFGDYKHCACFIKAGNITKSGKSDVGKMDRQLREAMGRDFINPLDSKSRAKTEEFYIVCNGQINRDARGYIHDLVYANSLPNVRIIDLDKLINIITTQVISKINSIDNQPYMFDLKTYPKRCRALK
jgi:hypothetical protein